jgi:hypothetical protein
MKFSESTCEKSLIYNGNNGTIIIDCSGPTQYNPYDPNETFISDMKSDGWDVAVKCDTYYKSNNGVISYDEALYYCDMHLEQKGPLSVMEQIYYDMEI